MSSESAHVEGADSETLVADGHLCQDHPGVIAEVRRILLEHLAEMAGEDGAIRPTRRPSSAATGKE